MVASDLASANFGLSISIYGDYVVVGAFKDDAGGSNSGCAYIFKDQEQLGSNKLN